MSAQTDMADLTLEAELAAELGCPRKNLTDLRRELVEGLEWEWKGNAIAYTPAGLEKIQAALALRRPLASAKKESGPEPFAVTIRRLARHNRRIVFAQKTEVSGELTVRVRNAAMFIVGQEISVRRESDGSLHLFGHQPRRKGRL